MLKPTTDVERVFDSILHLTAEQQKELRIMLRGRDWPAPPEQMSLKHAAPARSHKKAKPEGQSAAAVA